MQIFVYMSTLQHANLMINGVLFLDLPGIFAWNFRFYLYLLWRHLAGSQANFKNKREIKIKFILRLTPTGKHR